MTKDLNRTPLFHITDVENLAGIVAGGLLSDKNLIAQGGPTIGIGYDHIKQRRLTQTRVPCSNNRFVGEFVPFYFCPRSVMLFVVNKGSTGRPPGCQRTILHLVTSVSRAIGTGSEWAYSDGNAGAAYPTFFNNEHELDARLNWDAINEKANWSSVRTEKQAEFLVADTYPWDAILAVGCFDENIAQKVTDLLSDVPNAPKVLVRRDWYY
jgi:hypothetical protein